jgi:hypothetical protein
MTLSAPKVITFWIAVILALLGILAYMGSLPSLASMAFFLVAAGFILLAIANMVKGL